MTDQDARETDDAEEIDPQVAGADVLMTGFPGFLAGRLLGELRDREPTGRLHLLVEPRFRDRAERQMDRLEREHGEFEGGWTIHEGDITDEQLGLDAAAYERLTDEVGVVWHLAALYDLAVDEAPAYRVNVRGTVHVLDFCEACQAFERLNYVSTCYVSGERTGWIREDELDEGQGHKNHYESTKFWAEVEVQRRWESLPTVIMRPSIVVGDSETGETNKFDGPYYLFDLLARIPDWVPIPNLGAGDAPVNLVPVDYATEAMAHLGCARGTEGSVYQLADPRPMEARELFAMAVELMDKTGPVGSVPSGVVDWAMSRGAISDRVDMPREALAYFDHPASWDTSHTERALEGTGIECPHLSTYLETLIEYFLRHR
ncbi:MAG: SDR family oxidoreductase [Bradymonadaceae bacterium]